MHKLEYLWLDGCNPTQIRSKTKVVKEFGKSGYKKTAIKRTKTFPSFAHQKIANDLSRSIGKEVKLKVANSGKGRIEILFKSEEELHTIIRHFEK